MSKSSSILATATLIGITIGCSSSETTSSGSGGAPPGSCPVGQTTCAGVCVDVAQDPDNCGVCGERCDAGSACQLGACACLPGLTDCAGVCVDLGSDGNHCGACQAACPTGQVCSEGQCGGSCTIAGQTVCGNSCVDLNSDPLNCGGCGTQCSSAQSCTGGSCACSGELVLCNGTCVDIANNATHCGGCGIACGAGQTCENGSCSGGPQGTGGGPVGGFGGSTGGGGTLGGMGPAGGTAATGGLGTGGEATGGASLGGAGTGGASAGGSATGGINTGGSATGGINTGGSATGGINTGGSATGGINTGGSATGGINTGGSATGGSATGGQSSGSCDFSSLTSYEGNGSVTFYDPSGQVNCSFPMSGSSVVNVSTGNGEYIVAMGPTDYGNSATCGACVEVTRDDGQSVTVTVADQCPECQAGHIDLSRAAFLQIGTESEGYLGTTNGGAVGIISWRYVPCPVQGNVIITLKEPSNQGWNEFMVQNSRLPIVSFEANWSGSWVTGTRQTYNYFNVGGSLSFPLQVRLTDINGNVIEGTLQANQADQDLGVQFPSCN